MNATITSLWTLPELDLEIVTLERSEYGSADEDALERLADQLGWRLEQAEAGRIVLDVSAVRYAGAAWLGVIARFASQCRDSGRRLLISGDRTGLLRFAGLDQSVRLYRDVATAIGSCPSPTYAWPRRVSLPIAMLNPAPC